MVTGAGALVSDTVIFTGATTNFAGLTFSVRFTGYQSYGTASRQNKKELELFHNVKHQPVFFMFSASPCATRHRAEAARILGEERIFFILSYSVLLFS